MSRALTIAYIFDNLLLALLTLGNCEVGDTLSSKAYQLDVNGKLQGKIFRPLIDWLLSPIEKDHCHVCWLIENKFELWHGSNL